MKLASNTPRALGPLLAVAFGMASPLAAFAAASPIATIYGLYDTGGVGDLPPAAVAGLTPINSGASYDTPALFFVNPTGYAITGAQMVLSVDKSVNAGQNTLNDGVTETVALGSLAAGSVTQVNWAGAGALFRYDYDDMYPTNYGVGLAGNIGSSSANCTLNTVGGHPEWANFCAPVGNFKVAFSGVLSGNGANNGAAVAAVFASTDVDGHFTGWQGLDPQGWSENQLYDLHVGHVSGVLANIYLGTVDTVPTSPIPELGTLVLTCAGLGLIAAAARCRS